MRARTTPIFAFLTIASILAACGGADSKGAVSPTNEDAKALEADASAANPDPPDAGPTTTTTVTLADGGDLQGMKLTTNTSRTVDAPDGGAKTSPAPPGHTPDPGRKKEDIQAIVMARRNEARACYDAERKKNPKISEGDLWIDWIIDPEGNPTNMALNAGKSQITEPAVVNCVIDILKKIKFSKSAGGYQTTTYYPFNFKRGSKPAQ